MPAIPHADAFDSTLALLRDPYRFISATARGFGTDVFVTRLLLQPALCVTGPEAAELFSDTSKFTRSAGMPAAIKKTLLGQGGVQGLDGEEHRRRKGMLLSLMTRPRIDALLGHAAQQWRRCAREWAERGEVVLYDELHVLLTRAVCRWAGVPLPYTETAKRARQLALMFDGAADLGWRHVQSRRARVKAEAWLVRLIERIRAGKYAPPSDSAAYVIAHHRTLAGELLPARIAAVDLLNVLRPTVAVSVFIAQAAHAIEHHPEVRERLAEGDPDYRHRFVQECRRYYPFFPATAASVRDDFEWRGYRFPAGTRVMLDLYGTDHDPRAWDHPERFDPERFVGRDVSPFDLIPQGGGDHATNHRCAGEWITIGLMEQAAAALTGPLQYNVPPQDDEIDFGRMPAIPRSRFRINAIAYDDLGVDARVSEALAGDIPTDIKG